MKNIHICGWIEKDWCDFPSIDEIPIHRLLNDEIDMLGVKTKYSYYHNKENDYNIEISSLVENVSMQVHVSEKEITLDDANYNKILMSIGELDICETWYGYSEYTIEGYDIESFSLIGNDGEHDLNKILLNYVGKYLNMVVSINESEN